MYWILSLLGSIAGLISLVCFILVLIKMFQAGQTGMGVVCIVLFFCIGIGEIIACVLAWQNAGRWRLTQNFLMLFTISLAAYYVLFGAWWAVAPKTVVVIG